MDCWTTSKSSMILALEMFIYPLVNIQKAIENGHRNSGFFPLKIVIFHCYVSSPEGSLVLFQVTPCLMTLSGYGVDSMESHRIHPDCLLVVTACQARFLAYQCLGVSDGFSLWPTGTRHRYPQITFQEYPLGMTNIAMENHHF